MERGGGQVRVLEAGGVDAQRHHAEALGRQPEPLGHDAGKEAARRHKQVHVVGAFRQQFPRFGAVPGRQGIQEGILAGEQADHRRAHPLPQAAGQTQEEQVGKHDVVRLGTGLEPGHQLLQFTGLVAVLAVQHREGQIADLGRAGFGGQPAHPAQQPGLGQQTVQPGRHRAQQRPLLGEVHVDPAEENRRPPAGGRFVQLDRQVQRHQERVVSLATPLTHQRVVPYAVAAVGTAGAGSDLNEVHGRVGVVGKSEGLHAAPQP